MSELIFEMQQAAQGNRVPECVEAVTMGVSSWCTHADPYNTRWTLGVYGWSDDDEPLRLMQYTIAEEGDSASSSVRYQDHLVYRVLDHILKSPMKREDGSEVKIHATAISVDRHRSLTTRLFAQSAAEVGALVWPIRRLSRYSTARNGRVWVQTISGKRPWYHIDAQVAAELLADKADEVSEDMVLAYAALCGLKESRKSRTRAPGKSKSNLSMEAH